MNIHLSTNKRLLVLILLAGCLLSVLGFLSMYSLVTIKGMGDDNKSIYIHWGDEDNQRKIFNLTNNSKTFFLRKQPIAIEVTSGDKKSVYKKNIGGFPKQEISVETSPKKQSFALGESFLRCAISDDSNKRITYYPCAPALGSAIETITEGEKASVLFNNLIPREDFGGEYAELDITSMILPYRNGFIAAAALAGNLYIGEYTLAGDSVGTPIKIGNFDSNISEDTISVVNDNDNSNLAILNTTTDSLYLFNNPQDSDPSIVKLSDKLNDSSDAQIKTVLSSSKSVYVVNYRDPSLLETHDHDGTNDKELDKEVSVANNSQTVTEVTTKEKSVHVHKLPKDLVIRDMAISPLGEIVFLPHYSETNQQIFLLRNGKMQSVPFVINNVGKLCWSKSNELYYSISGSSDIYKYSFNKQGSFLLYNNSNAALINMDCSFGKLSFSLKLEGDGLINEVSHFQLTDFDYGSKPLEEILPMYIDLPNNSGVIRVTQDGSSAAIGLVYGSKSIPSRDEILKLVKDRFEAYRIDVENLQLKFSF